MDRADLRVYMVTGSAGDVDATVAAAVAGGATMVQLRDPTAPTRRLMEAARRLLDLLAPTGVPLIVNDRVDVALAAGAAGVHLGQSDLHPADARRLASDRPGFIVGWSVTNRAQAEEAAAMAAGTVDYLGAGPINPTPTKTDAKAPIGVNGLAAICAAAHVPVVAIGGVGVADAARCVAAGAAGVAVVSAISASADPAGAAAALRVAVDRTGSEP